VLAAEVFGELARLKGAGVAPVENHRSRRSSPWGTCVQNKRLEAAPCDVPSLGGATHGVGDHENP
jgi:hypothetical protein